MGNERELARDLFAFETITVSSTSIGGTAATYEPDAGGAQYALFTLETEAIRGRADGTAPTASVGHLVTAGGVIEIHGINTIRNFRAIRVTTDATLRASYGR